MRKTTNKINIHSTIQQLSKWTNVFSLMRAKKIRNAVKANKLRELTSVPMRWVRACVRKCLASDRASERANAWGVVYLAEREARLRTTVKEVPMSYGAEGERRRAYVPLQESRIASLASRSQVGRPPTHSCSRNPFN